jgi:U4/U6.U5 tri-snRNP-associated protein 3
MLGGISLVMRSRSNSYFSERDGGRERSRDRRGGERERDRDRERDTRSRSPRRERERDRETEKEKLKEKIKPSEEEFVKSRTETPPVSFKVVQQATSQSGGQDHDRMDLDPETKSKDKKKGKKGKGKEKSPAPEEDDEIIVEDDGLAAMQAMMGFGGFGTTHQQKVAGNDIYAVRKEKKTEYRQYMNRVGGFNRPLSPTRE